MTQESRMTPKAERALAVLRSGGYWRKQLESGWQGREQFHTRLRDARGRIVKGYGFQTYQEHKAAGLLRWRECGASSVWPEEWILAEQKEQAA